MLFASSAPATGIDAADTVSDLEVTTDDARLSRSQVVDRILALNPGATRDFLSRFTGPALAEYLEHLTLTQEPRGRGSGWVRRAGQSAITARVSRP